MNKLNRMLVIMLIEITMILLTGCVPEKGDSLVNDVMNAVKHKIENEWQSIESWVTEDDTESDYIDPETEEVSKKAYLIIRALKSRDEKTIFMMFNGYIRKNYKEKLENDINEVFDLVEGDIISFDKPSIYESSRMTDENGILIRCQYVSIYNICTDKGKRYEVTIQNPWDSITTCCAKQRIEKIFSAPICGYFVNKNDGFLFGYQSCG